MKRRRRVCRWLKWAGLSACFLIFSIWLCTLCPYPGLEINCQTIGTGICATVGRIYLHIQMFDGKVDFSEFHFSVRRPPSLRQRTWIEGVGLQWPELTYKESVGVIDDPQDKWSDKLIKVKQISIIMPFWLLFVLTAVPTAFFWWRDRQRIPPGHCRKCGYNLTGNVSGVCSECGEKI